MSPYREVEPVITAADRKRLIRERALAIGFDAIGFCGAGLATEARERLAAFLTAGQHGDMGWLASRANARGDPCTLWPDARSVVAVGVSYAPEHDPLGTLRLADRGSISVYARNRDYHDVIKGRLKEIAGLIRRRGPEAKVFVDTAPVMEKPLAEAAGLGWQGKHTVLVSKQFGSWLFLGAIFTSAELPADVPHEESCGSCTRCLEICPTHAFPAPFRLDARRCLSYLNIEHKGPIPREFRAAMGNRIYGCDDCLAVCPWNKFASAARDIKLMARDDLNAPSLADLARLDEAGFRAMFAGSPIKRIGHARFLRNVLIALGNSGDAALAPLAEARLGDPDPLIRGAAVWAVRRLVPTQKASHLALDFLAREADTTVRSEWTSELV
jgi:epoxyqueuosine reductase